MTNEQILNEAMATAKRLAEAGHGDAADKLRLFAAFNLDEQFKSALQDEVLRNVEAMA